MRLEWRVRNELINEIDDQLEFEFDIGSPNFKDFNEFVGGV